MPARCRSQTNRPRPGRGTGWLWQAMLVFGPLLVLAGLGVWGIRESRMAAKRHAIQNLEATAPIVEKMAAEIWEFGRQLNLPFQWPPPSVPIPGKAGPGAALYERMQEAGPDEANRLAEEIERDHEDETTTSGLPVLPLVKWFRLQQASPGAPRQRAAHALDSETWAYPSILSGELLARAEAFLAAHGEDTTEISEARARLAYRERASAILDAAPPVGELESGWLPQEHPQWFFHRFGPFNWYSVWSPERLRYLADRISARARHADFPGSAYIDLRGSDAKPFLPAYVTLDVSGLGEQSLLTSPPLGERLFTQKVSNSPLTIGWVLTDVAGLYAEQRQQERWLGALLVTALLAAATGFFALRRSLSRERQLSEMKSNFVSSVSHELRAPLASMRLMAENLETGVVTEEPRRAEYHRLMADECRRLGTLVDNVLDFARIEQGRKTYHFAETDLSALVADTLRLLRPMAERRGQKFVCEVELITPRCDGLAIQQALVNLLDNALKFSPAHSTVTVHVAARTPAEWALSVSDEGPGVPPPEREKIFERFYRVGSELTRETQGAGIGLSIVKHIAEGHGGRVHVEKSTFTLVLPMAPIDSTPGAESPGN